MHTQAEDAQLHMYWPSHLLRHSPEVQFPSDYKLRTCQTGDEARFYTLMQLAGWPGWDGEKLTPWLARIIPECWFMLEDADGVIVATAMGLHSHEDAFPFGGELGWVAADPQHWGRGLGMAVSAAVTRRLLEAGYRNIHLYTERFRLAAIKTYLKLGYVPFLYNAEMPAVWRSLCAELEWDFTPEEWRRV